MKNRKKERMDAIERRLAVLERLALPPAAYLEAHGWKRNPVDQDGILRILWVKDDAALPGIPEQDAWEYQCMLEDSPEFCCQPDYRLEPDDDRLIRERTVGEILPEALRTGRCGKWDVEDRGAWTMSGSDEPGSLRYPSDDVRERVRERSDLADAHAGVLDESMLDRQLADARADRNIWYGQAQRYENSLRALLQMLLPAATVGAIRRPPDHADLFAMVEGCLAGGTITLDGLQQDD